LDLDQLDDRPSGFRADLDGDALVEPDEELEVLGSGLLDLDVANELGFGGGDEGSFRRPGFVQVEDEGLWNREGSRLSER
jgi:hypothetical protein